MPQAVAEVLHHLTMLPPFSQVTTKLLEMINDDTVSIDELNAVVSADPSLVSKVIHLANSPFYMVSRPVESVKEALFVLGLSSIKNIVAGLSVQQGFAKVQPRTDTFSMLDFWKHSYATAIVAKRLGSQVDRKLGDTLYLAGLIHDVGKIVLANFWPEVWRGIVHAQAHTKEPFCVVEGRLFPHSHAQIAGELFMNWKFPQTIAAMVENHHSEESSVMSIPGVQILQKADAIVNAAGFSFPLGNCDDTLPAGVVEFQSLIENLGSELDYQLRVLQS